MGSRAALLPGRVFDVPGLLAKLSALSYSGSTGVSLLGGLCVHGLLEPGSCSIPALLCPGAAAPPGLVCQPHPCHPSCRTWLIRVPGQEGGSVPGVALAALHSPAPAPRACGAGACPELMGWPSWFSVAFFIHIYPVDFFFFFWNHINFIILCQI